MEENQKPGEQITRHLLFRENEDTEEVKCEDYASSVTGVLLFSSFIAVCGSFNYGLAVGYSSPVESEIIDDLGISTAEYSLFASFLTIGGALGAIACGKMSDYLGRKRTFGVSDVLSIAGWFAIIASQGVLPLYVGRLLLGFAAGLSTYVDLRGRFVTLHIGRDEEDAMKVRSDGPMTRARARAMERATQSLVSRAYASDTTSSSPKWVLLVTYEGLGEASSNPT